MGIFFVNPIFSVDLSSRLPYTKWTGRETDPATKNTERELFIKTEKTPNYTDAQTATIRDAAPVNKAVAQTLADSMGKTLRSVIAKATREGVYVAQGKTTKSGDPVVSKSDLVTSIAAIVGGNLEGLDKAPKVALHALARFANANAGE